jgi:hypothetical protein
VSSEIIETPVLQHSFEIEFEGYFSTLEENGRDRRRMIDGWFWVTVEGRDVEACRWTAVEVARAHLEESFKVAPFSMFRSRYVGENEGRWKLDDGTRVRAGAWRSATLLVTSHPWSPRRLWYQLRALARP